MTDTEKPFDIHSYINLALRRKWYIVIPLILSIVGSFGVYKYLPKIYKATTLILVQPQRVPESYIRPTVTEPIAARLNTITQEILSRTRLEKVIQEFNLYSDLLSKKPLEEIVEVMRKAVEVKVQGSSRSDRDQNAFSISFEGKEPRTVMMVTNKLASLFIEENLKVRELQAEGTSEFLTKELQAIENQLKQKEQDLRNFRERYMGQLPQQLDANLRILERLQEQLKTTNESIRASEDRAILLRNQIEELRQRGRLMAMREPRGNITLGTEERSSGPTPEDPIMTQWNLLKRELANAQSKYTDNHPDVIDLKRKFANLEQKVKELLEQQKAAREARLRELKSERDAVSEKDVLPAMDPAIERLLAQYKEQYNEVQFEIKRLKGEEKNLKEQIVVYRKRIEDTPKREQELALLTRDYDLLKTNYQSLLDKKIQAQMAENLERKQQGEQFRILDPARIPEMPFKPDRNKILIMGVMIGLLSGFGLAWFRESLDKSFHTVSEVEAYLGIPVIATIPNLQEEHKKAA